MITKGVPFCDNIYDARSEPDPKLGTFGHEILIIMIRESLSFVIF